MKLSFRNCPIQIPLTTAAVAAAATTAPQTHSAYFADCLKLAVQVGEKRRQEERVVVAVAVVLSTCFYLLLLLPAAGLSRPDIIGPTGSSAVNASAVRSGRGGRGDLRWGEGGAGMRMHAVVVRPLGKQWRRHLHYADIVWRYTAWRLPEEMCVVKDFEPCLKITEHTEHG